MSDWIWPLEALKTTPSIRAGLTKEQELLWRREGIKLLSEVGNALNCKPRPTIGVAAVYFHRFYMIHSFQSFSREVTALSCLFLAGKVEDFPKKCKDVCQAAVTHYPEIYSKYQNLVDDVMGLERVLLHSLKFDLHVALPYDALLDYKMMFPDMNREKITDAVQIAWTFINDSIYTTLCITTEPQMIAIALLHLAFTVKGYQPVQKNMDPCWWSADVSNWPQESVDKACHLVLDFYAATKEKPVLEKKKLTTF
ncbi:Cyclin-like domain-containing protein [Caenorhabditis elegans]|uniref:Cyclin-like domain-containing protein n=1 Tax=Caenorhabditis elegans TaxID=6239 RepID=O17869_CAEEL|nr:Cyclin-like domain-containing protein [Caenorhabditis elegans]CAB05724.2 Cyclin-like domain-containing protein [Caenorhabditis elegans]|eukprot:NP_506615.2 CyCliN K [Caenorhabditis elegans]